MARAGIYKSEVLRARDRLLSQGMHPSIDSIRVELGNTGSKTTISRYLKEIEEEEGGQTTGTVAVSESISELVSRLAERLHEEAEVRFREQTSRHECVLQSAQNELEASRLEAAGCREQIECLQSALDENGKELDSAHSARREQATLCVQLQQQVSDFQERISAAEAHAHSLEALHQNARDALEHFRQASKEQREQLQRQHDQQVAHLQSELRTQQECSTRVQQQLLAAQRESVEVGNELKVVNAYLVKAEARAREFDNRSERLRDAERRVQELERRLVKSNSLLTSVDEERRQLAEENRSYMSELKETTAELATLRSAGSIHDQVFATIEEKVRALMSAGVTPKRDPRISRRAKKAKTDSNAPT